MTKRGSQGKPRNRMIYGESRSTGVDWMQRGDPLYDTEVKDYMVPKWSFEHLMNPRLEMDDSGIVKPVLRREPVVLDRPMSHTLNGWAVMAVAMLSEYNHLTTHQVATLLGRTDVGRVRTTLEELTLAGLVQRKDPDWTREQREGMDAVWRLQRSIQTTGTTAPNKRLSRWMASLDPVVWALLCNGVEPDLFSGTNGLRAGRHNLVTNEILIRAMEANPAIIGAWGERHCRMDAMHLKTKVDEGRTRNNIADSALVTRGGKLILLETSGSKLGHSSGKHNGLNKIVGRAAAWVIATAYSDLDVHVVFVEAAMNPEANYLHNLVNIGITNHSMEYVRRESARQLGMEKIHTVDARRWFPGPRGISEDFLNLRVRNALTGRHINLIEDSDLETNTESDLVKNTLAALHVPPWIARMPDLTMA